MNRHPLFYLLLVVTLFAASGASCPNFLRMRRDPAAPVVFRSAPALQEVLTAVNNNSQAVRQLQTTGAKLDIPGAPDLSVNMALDRPKRFRLSASFIGVGRVLDLGSNDQMFWALVDPPRVLNSVEKAVYFARHDQFQRGAVAAALPVEPSWLIESLGLVDLDPNAQYRGPYSAGQGRLEILVREPSPMGDFTKKLILDDQFGWVLEQHIYDPRGQLIASASSSKYRYYQTASVSLPHDITASLPTAGMKFRIKVDQYAVNQLVGDPNQLWSMPNFNGYKMVDLGRLAPNLPPPNLQSPNVPAPSVQRQPYSPDYPRAGFRPVYRGYSTRR